MLRKDEIEELWKKFKEEGDSKFRDSLILYYSPLAKYVAGKIAAGLPQSVELADLISCGILGLIDAVDKFDHRRKIKFETYAISRIRGAILDELRSMDWMPRSLRSKAREIERAIISLENRLQRVPTDEELAEELNISLAELNNTLARLNYSCVLALDELWTLEQDENELGICETIVDYQSEDPYSALEVKEIRDVLRKAITYLTDREKEIITLYYFHGFTFGEIGEVLGLTESRISQIHTKIMLRLKGYLRGLMGDRD
ncbi:RNA polymerase sigma factor for flagellar operon FliA [Candidatus Hakubella thermalkaliphila]|uniref:RNA polymerase sigma factor n=1 Tax=Candidatus Hakubella thermalkaliphila TaxID=2754717 RepID=A0A6V8NRZ3_9ACTN|nr:FliA/WhiG family RNA polymerase sigma factor [Candidatus Hakubella thermalkaliphila]GFP23065.1 RNA polymerase sigma factor for flagellar operon FliA [Candidatus Hakubella thermalkaliphila]